ncbi:hypothetical protein Bca4012_073966 [Brassica carinata]|uniref:Uncharacterized protein n=5 Tax=Brassica TaxID=3705 RepID=A0A3P5Z004_BRACM|nr:unnamed protein product [Brassica napus]CAF2100952.1 unnamed protein product [Brassica napus]CAG7877339.1 unnamed protein product [Brassica rapa]VDC72369.1 unnamed protein product [Brassica rapa]VDD46120.1 unnamed protein product [Brassica oleracea]
MEQREELSWMKEAKQEFLQGSSVNINLMMHRDYWVRCAETLSFFSELQLH